MKSSILVLSVALLAGCDGGANSQGGDAGTTGAPDAMPPIEHPDDATRYAFANGCYALGTTDADGAERWLRASDDEHYAFDATSAAEAAPFVMKASDLATYLFYDADAGYLVAEDGPILRETTLQSDVSRVDDNYVSGAEWQLEFSDTVSLRYRLRNRRTDDFLGFDGLVNDGVDAAALTIEPAEGCADHPEMSLDATGAVLAKTYEDGALYGFVDTHSHILSNFGFGGGGVFHGAAFHRLGVTHAMGDCELFHGPEGRADFLGWGFSDESGTLDEGSFLSLLSTGRLPEPNHATDGWPTFTDWPTRTSSTHQTQYYKWLERAWMSGLRLMVQHAVSNEAFCDLMADTGFQPVRYGCEDMLNIDRQLVEVRRMERYIDAQSGGPGEGWFRIVESPEAARDVIAQGKLAIILGIEVPNLFDCYLTPRPGGPECDTAHIELQLDRYRERGVRAVFPNHKYDNAFTPGDGHRGIVELGNFITTGHWSNYVEDCPVVDTVFDKGRVVYGGFNEPREEFLAPAPNPLIQFTMMPLMQLLPYSGRIREPALDGEWCQKAGLTAAGTTLMRGMMKRGMIPEIDHLPRRSYLDAFALLVESDYPAAGTHGNTNDGKLFALGGVSKAGFGRCADPADPGSMASRFRDHRDQIVAAGGFGAEGFGFDLNGLAGIVGPRFGADANCADVQQNPVEYPFQSYAGDVTFEQPRMGERVVDFNTEGMIHIGLVAELIEDARRTGVSDDDLDIVFRSAEAYIRMWERAEQRSRELQ